jgi:hypothetical protein
MWISIHSLQVRVTAFGHGTSPPVKFLARRIAMSVMNGASAQAQDVSPAASMARQSIAAAQAIAPYPGAKGALPPLPKIAIERKWDVVPGGTRFGRTNDPETAFRSLSPSCSDEEVQSAGMGEGSSAIILLPQLHCIDFNSRTTFQCLVLFFADAADRTTPTVLVENYFRRIHAPAKKLFKIDREVHGVVFDASDEMLVDLVRYIRRLARDVGK